MNQTSRLAQGLSVALFTLLLSGGALSLWAQTDEQEPIEPVPPEQQEVEGDEDPPETTPEETVADDSPFDYQSSEKISEDLSVSFPVDI